VPTGIGRREVGEVTTACVLQYLQILFMLDVVAAARAARARGGRPGALPTAGKRKGFLFLILA
jgi:hypothetical protein